MANILSGTVKENGSPVSRTVRAYRRDTGALLGEVSSNAVDGSFSIDTGGYAGLCQVVALDDAAGTAYNALIFGRVTPVVT